jgi:flagellar hook-length control protein FliK
MSMSANLNFLTAPAPHALRIGEDSPSTSTRPSAGRSMLGKEFANLMRGLLPEGERQDLAASGAAASQAGLQTLALGKQFSVITVDAPQPDANSLAAFAKAQGLNDQAVQALFGDLAPISPPAGLKLSSAADTSTADPMAWLKDQPRDVMSAAMTPPSWFGNPLSPSLVHPTLTGAATGGSPLLLGQAAINAASGVPGAADTGTDTTNNLTALLAASGAAATIAQMSKVEAKAPVPPTPGLTPPPEPGPLDVMRMRLMPAWENMTKTLAQATGDTVFPWAAVAAGLLGSQGKEVPTLDIDLGDLGGLGAIGSATDMGNGMGTVSATFNNDNRAQMSQTADNRASLTLAGANQAAAGAGTDRVAQIDQLTDKLGQALSERLQDQMEQGQWKMELRLKPAHLGKISVELDMRAGGLDALFKSDNPLTRELIAQSAPKLRDSLAQAGMAVANVWVNSDGQGQTGGNPTPRQTPAGVNVTDRSLSNPADMNVQAPKAKSSDGWDELV